MTSPRGDSSQNVPNPSIVPNSPPLEKDVSRLQSVMSHHKTFHPSITDFNIIDIGDGVNAKRIRQKECDGENAIANLTSSIDGARLRIISIPAYGTEFPLYISFEAASKMLAQYDVDVEFKDTLFSFGRPPQDGEGGCSDIFRKSHPNGNESYGYQVQYIEDNERNIGTWSHRHTGVYHRTMPSTDGNPPYDLFILLHSSIDSAFNKVIQSLLTGSTEARLQLHARLLANPMYVNELALQAHLSVWRKYLLFESSNYGEIRKHIYTSKDPSSKPDEFAFSPMRKLRAIRGDVLTAQAYCSGTAAVIEVLQLQKQHHQHQPQQLTHSGIIDSPFLEVTAPRRIQSIATALAALQEKINNSLAMLEYSLSLVNDVRAAETNDMMQELTLETRQLTQDTVDDSAAVRIITYVSLLYLPGSFVSSIYGMNFFDFDEGDRGFIMSKKIWIYFTTWLPLTIITALAYWGLKKRKERIKRRKRQAHQNDLTATRVRSRNARSIPEAARRRLNTGLAAMTLHRQHGIERPSSLRSEKAHQAQV